MLGDFYFGLRGDGSMAYGLGTHAGYFNRSFKAADNSGLPLVVKVALLAVELSAKRV